MSMDLGGAKGGVKSDINVTPLVDVMLVLLIIMMLVAPLLQQGIAVTLPKATNSVDKPETRGQTTIAISVDKQVYLNGSMDNPNIVKLTTSNDEDGSTRVLFGGGARVRISGFYTM